jgi:hypothetical protein
MVSLIEKISSYNLFNYLLPGIIFVALVEKLTSHSLIQQDLIIGAFLYYFIGLAISRFGSLVIEPFLRWTKFLKFTTYKDFVIASKKDHKIELFSEVNNTYRTLCSLFALLLLLKIYDYMIATYIPFLTDWDAIILLVLLFVMFLLSYRKQTQYITQRIKANE